MQPDEALFYKGTPAQLNSLLGRRKIDLCLSSSIEYARNPSAYLLLPKYCIASKGPLPSIQLFSRLTLDRLDNARIVLTDQSATTVALCRILLGHLMNYSNEYITKAVDLQEGLREGDAVVLIGDRALEAGIHANGIYAHDLSLLWEEMTGLPFVFALWIVRKDLTEKEGNLLAGFWHNLSLVHEYMVHPEEELIRMVLHERPFLTKGRLLEYWQMIAYQLTEKHLQGLELFYRFAFELGYIPRKPEVVFWDPEKNF